MLPTALVLNSNRHPLSATYCVVSTRNWIYVIIVNISPRWTKKSSSDQELMFDFTAVPAMATNQNQRGCKTCSSWSTHSTDSVNRSTGSYRVSYSQLIHSGKHTDVPNLKSQVLWAWPNCLIFQGIKLSHSISKVGCLKQARLCIFIVWINLTENRQEMNQLRRFLSGPYITEDTLLQFFSIHPTNIEWRRITVKLMPAFNKNNC